MALTRQRLESIYRELEVPLYNFALRWVFNSQLAEEVVHDAFIRVWRRSSQVEEHSLKGLLYKTVQNLAINELRRRRLRETIGILDWFKTDEGPRPNAESDLIEHQSLKAMKAGLEKLPMEMREVLLLTQFSDMSYAEISKQLNVAEGTVASRKNRAMQMMREHFTAEEKTNGK